MVDYPWWQGAVIYQIYPRSFFDSNGDGVGDINGIVEKVDYIASLGVDAIWVSPVFQSPMKDFGYDVSDYRDIAPMFGTLAQFDALISAAHDKGLKIVIDQVLSHTSDQHQWFQQSRQDKSNDKADWYVWADAKDDGTPPNNWMSIFGGVAWQWEPRREQYYLHNFLSSQPDLNFHNPEVQQQILQEVEFWLKRGVDGLRLDAINFCFHDKKLRDNPAKPADKRQGRGFSEDNPYAYQYHYFNNTQPENLAFLKQLRSLLNQYPGTFALGEVSSEDSLATMAEYTKGDQHLHTAYSFELLTDDFNADYIAQTVAHLERKLSGSWPCWAVGNHDVTRVISRWGKQHQTPELAKMINALLVSLRGCVCVYQGEELGLAEAEVPFEMLQDPYGITFWPNFKGRDGCRTPMPWQAQQKHAGFTTGQPWLPVAATHTAMSVSEQQHNPNSVLNHYRNLLGWRKQQPGLRWGDIEFLENSDNLLIVKRAHKSQTIFAIFNLNQHSASVELPAATTELTGHGFNGYRIDDQTLVLEGFNACFIQQG